MPLTTIPIGLEVLNIALVWFIGLPNDLVTKIILTVAFVAKFVCYFSGALVTGIDNPILRNVLLALCALINGGVIVFSIITSSWMLLINNAILLIMLVVWSFVVVFDITWTWGKRE